ncbi:MAG: IS1634 family transposase [Candidatus Competibacteraceae bacterium]
MYLRTTSNGRRQYLQIAESYRDDTGQVRQRHIASLGRLDRLLENDSLKGLIDGLLKISGRGSLNELAPGVTDDNTQFEPARSVGAIWVVCQLWQQLGLGAWLQSRLNGRGYRVKMERLIRILVANRLCDPCAKLGAFKRALVLDGKLIVVTNVPEWDAAEEIARYKALADIERGFRVLKSQLGIAPVHHRRADRIRANTLICFLALVIQRRLRHRLRASTLDLSPATVLERLEAVQYHTVRLVTGQGISNLGQIAPPLRRLFNAIDMEIPTRTRIESTL